jgi:hypothetical protein
LFAALDDAFDHERPTEADRGVLRAAVRDEPADERAADRHARPIGERDAHVADDRQADAVAGAPFAQTFDVAAARLAEVEVRAFDEVPNARAVTQDREEVFGRGVQDILCWLEHDQSIDAERGQQFVLQSQRRQQRRREVRT